MTRKWIAATLAALLALGAWGMSDLLAQSTGPGTYFWWKVEDERGQAFTGENVACTVSDPNQHAYARLHTDSLLSTELPQPLWSDVNGRVHLYSSSQAPKNVVCIYRNGGIAQVNKLDRFTHRIVIDRQGRRVAFFSAANTATAANQSTSVSIPGGAVVRDIIIRNLNPKGLATTYHISVGFAGNHAVAANDNALARAIALTSPDEWLRPHATVDASGFWLVQHRGTALSRFVASHGSGVGSLGYYSEVPYIVHTGTGLDVVYSITIPTSITAANVHVYIFYELYHMAIDRQGITN